METCLAMTKAGDRCRVLVGRGAPLCHKHWSPVFDKWLAEQRGWYAEEVRRILDSAYAEADKIREWGQRDADALMEAAALRMAAAVDAGAPLTDRVYFFAVGEPEWDHVKVGHSNDPERRVAMFRRGRGCLIPEHIDPAGGRILGTIPGGAEVEGRVHFRLREARIGGGVV